MYCSKGTLQTQKHYLNSSRIFQLTFMTLFISGIKENAILVENFSIHILLYDLEHALRLSKKFCVNHKNKKSRAHVSVSVNIEENSTMGSQHTLLKTNNSNRTKNGIIQAMAINFNIFISTKVQLTRLRSCQLCMTLQNIEFPRCQLLNLMY